MKRPLPTNVHSDPDESPLSAEGLDAAIRAAQDNLMVTDNRWEMVEDGRMLALNLDAAGERNVAMEVRNAIDRLKARLEGGD